MIQGGTTVGSPVVVAGGSPEVSHAARQRIAEAFGGRFFLRWYASMGRFGVCARWEDNDRRHDMVRQSEIAEDQAFDLIAMLPYDCPLEDAVGYIERQLLVSPHENYRNLARALQRQRATHVPAEAQASMDEFANMGEVLVKHRHERAVYMSDTEARSTRVSDEARDRRR